MIFNLDTMHYLARSPYTALTAAERLRGMIGRRFSPAMDAMVFPNCNAIHSFFMSAPIDVVFLDREGRVVGLRAGLPPWRPVVVCREAATVIELPAGAIAASSTEIGHRINLNCTLTAEAVAKLQRGDILS